MAWHILHGLLEQVRIQSTFPGKLWIVVMLIFRIVVVARIGDMVYHDEQDHFFCNTLTPGCNNVCFNRFSPISQLRYWSLMVLVVSTPAIFFYLYATHIIYHASVKYPSEEEEEKKQAVMSPPQSDTSYLHAPSLKRRRDHSMSTLNGHGPPNPLYEVTTIPKPDNRYKTSKLSRDLRRRRHHQRNNREDVDVKSTDKPRKGSVTDNNYESAEDVFDYRTSRYPVYVDAQGRRVEFIKMGRRPDAEADAMLQRKFQKRMLQHPELARAYWWHVVIRMLLEVAFIVGQYFLYGWTVSELYNCDTWPCPKTVECFVSRPQEKTCLLWLMYGLGFIACALSIAEFWTMGIPGVKIAMVCCNDGETKEQRRRRLAQLEHTNEKKAHAEGAKPLTGAVSLDSLSSDTTVESV